MNSSYPEVRENAWSLNGTNTWNIHKMWVHQLYMVHELSKKYHQEFLMDCSLTMVFHLLLMNSWTIHGQTLSEQFIMQLWTCMVINMIFSLHPTRSSSPQPHKEMNSSNSWTVHVFSGIIHGTSFMKSWWNGPEALKSRWDILEMLLKYEFMNLVQFKNCPVLGTWSRKSEGIFMLNIPKLFMIN